MYKRLLLPVDGSPCSDQVIRSGLALARTFGAQVTFLYVTENPVVEIYGVSYGEQLKNDLARAGEEALGSAQRRAEAACVAAQTRLVTDSHPVEAILKVEAEHDLVIMGTHGRRGVRRFVLGSVTEEVLRRSQKPQLTLHCTPQEGS